MKILVSSYTFDASAQTVTFTGYGSIDLERVLLITNVTDQIIIYNFADSTKGGTVATNVLTLEHDTTSMDDADDLQIYYDDASAAQTVSDGGGSITIDNAVLTALNAAIAGSELQIDIVGALPAGTNAIGTVTAVGDVASGSADSGNPVKVGARFNSTLPTVTDGQRVDLQTTNRGILQVQLGVGTGGATAVAATTTNSDGQAESSLGTRLEVVNRNYVYNGTSYDRLRSIVNGMNSTGTGILASGMVGHYDDTSPGAVTENQFAPVRVSSNRNQYIQIRDGSGNERGANVNSSNQLSVAVDASVALPVNGPTAHDAALTAAPVTTGGYASAAAPTDVSADGDVVRSWYLRNGAQAAVLTAAGALIGGDATNGLDVDVTRIIPGTSATHLGKAIDTAAGSTDTGVASLAIRDDALTTLTPADGDWAPLRVDANGGLWVSLATKLNATDDAVSAVNNAQTSGGATPYKLISAATTNATNVKSSAGQLYGIQVYNTNAAARYLKLYNKASSPTVGTDTPVKVITIPGNTAGAGSNVAIPSVGIAFGTGISFALTTGAADSDTGAVAANEIIVNLDYK